MAGDLFKRVQNIVFWKRNQSVKAMHASSDDLKLLPSSKDSKEETAMTGFFYILERLISMLGLVFTDKVLDDLRHNSHLFGGSSPCFDNTDLLQLGKKK